MRGSIYLNRVNGNPEQITMSTSLSPAALLSTETPHGWLFDKVLGQLRVDRDVIYSERDRRDVMLLQGSTEGMIENARRLGSAIGGIAIGLRRNAKTHEIDVSWFSGVLGRLSTQVLPSLPEDHPFDRALGKNVVFPIADDTIEDGVYIVYRPRPTKTESAFMYLESLRTISEVEEYIGESWLERNEVTAEQLKQYLNLRAELLALRAMPEGEAREAEKKEIRLRALEFTANLDPYKGETIALK